MLRDVIASTNGGEIILGWIEWAALAIEVLAVVIIVVAIFYSIIRYSFQGLFKESDEDRYQEHKRAQGRGC